MVYVVLIVVALAVIGLFTGVLPSFPPTPDFLQGVADTAIDLFQTGMYLLSYLLTPPIFFGSMAIFVAVLIAEPVYHFAMWVIKKIPIINIK